MSHAATLLSRPSHEADALVLTADAAPVARRASSDKLTWFAVGALVSGLLATAAWTMFLCWAVYRLAAWALS